MDFDNLLQMANQMRERLSSAQGEAANLRVNGEAGGGLVRVVMNGQHELLEVKIDPKAMSGGPEDVKLLEDLLRAAVNQANGQVTTGLKDRLGGMAQDLGVDLSMFDHLGGKPK